jgi:HEPN domain-containing protein
MKPITDEWAAKAENDFATMDREAEVSQKPNYDIICFLAQQCAEKYLKARLCEADVVFSKIHDLSVLLDLAVAVEPGWESFRRQLVFLTAFAVNIRYPGYSANKEKALKAREYCREFRRAARKALELDPDL